MEPKQCMDVLALSYNHLSYDLKACFLYIGVFPQDFEIPVRRLIHIWVVEGFIQQIGDASAEVLAEQKLQDLVHKNLVLVEKRRADGRIKTCRIHSMLCDLCIRQAEQEEFFKEISPASSCPVVFRRLCIHSQVSDYISSKPDCQLVRVFLCYAKGRKVLAPKLVTYLPESFKLLRILDVAHISFPRFPAIKKVHLRYVALSGTFDVVSAAISKLWNLQTLILETSQTIKIQGKIWKLKQLRHVYTSLVCDLLTPSSKSKNGLVNENLRTVSKLSPNSCSDASFARMPKLQKLGVRGNLVSLLEVERGHCKFENFGKLSRLETLKLLNDTDPISKLHGLPGVDKFPQKLKKLTLSKTMLDWEDMSVIGKLPRLEVLKLREEAFVGERWETLDGCFVELRVLQIEKTDLVQWEEDDHHFPQLKRLRMTVCEQLVVMPSGLKAMPKLEVVELYRTSRYAVAAAAAAHRSREDIEVIVFPPEQENRS